VNRWLLLWAVGACASALHEPSPLGTLAPGRAHGRSAAALTDEANRAWARRGEPGQAEEAQDLYLDAAVADDHRIDTLLGAMRAIAYRIEHDRGVDRASLAGKEVEVGQWCLRRAQSDAECSYRLAIALGQQARERHATGKDALGHMVELLHAAIAKAPALDHAGPHRLLALVLLRAPGWPVGPGDPEAGLTEARAAAQLAADVAENQLVLGEALAANDQPEPARAALVRATELANAAKSTGDPDAAGWLADARHRLDDLGR
jgi:hypothetical protein